MADTERVPSALEQAEDSKEATLPLTPVSDGDGFKHGDHEDHLDAPNETSTPAELAGDANGTSDTLEAEHQPKDVTNASSEATPVASPPPKPKAAVSVDARTRKTSMQVGKPDPKAASTLRKVCVLLELSGRNAHRELERYLIWIYHLIHLFQDFPG